jgi:holliday junction DNA helicase RuvA
MIALLRGTLHSKQPHQVIVDVAGVGYEVWIPVSTFTGIPEVGAAVILHIYTNVREDAIQLFGFRTLDEKHLFEKLIGVNGVGPKLAITALSGIPPTELVAAIRAGDLVRLTKIPGVGKKTAERMILGSSSGGSILLNGQSGSESFLVTKRIGCDQCVGQLGQPTFRG